METQGWKSYEEVARYLLNQFREEFGLDRVEPKQEIKGKSGTSWQIDAKGVRESDTSAIVLVECRQYRKKRLNQEAVGGLAFRITDTGASGAILVSPLPWQKGAKKVASHANVVTVQLGPDSTPENFVISFFNKIFVGVTESVKVTDFANVELVDEHGEGAGK